MQARHSVILIGTLAVLTLIVAAVAGTLYFPYQQAKSRAEAQLSEALRAQAQLLLYLNESRTGLDIPGGIGDARDDPPVPLLPAQTLIREFPDAVEFSIGRSEHERSVLVFRSRNGQVDSRKATVQPDSQVAHFMQRALAGETGTEIGTDASGQDVLGAYRWIPELQLGLTAKIPMDQIRFPFIQAMLINSVVWIFVALVILAGFRFAILPVRRRLNMRELEYRAMFDSALDGIFIADREGTVRSINPSALSMLGYRASELTDRPISRVIAGANEPHADADIGRLIANAGGEPTGKIHEITARRKDGSTVPCNLRLSRLNVSGESLVMGMLRDTSEQKQTAQALVEAKEAAEAATRAKSEFLANMSHEVRSPMTGVSGMLELLRSTSLDDAQRQYVDLAQDAATAMLSVINDILDLSKIESGNLTLEIIEFDPAELVRQVTALFQQRAERKSIRIETRIHAELRRPSLGDPLRIRQVLTNLIDNAVKFTGEGTVLISLEPQGELHECAGLKFAVSDTGCGMTEEEQRKLFRPYMQAGLSTSRLHGGTGLGLSISRRIVELMGGEIGFCSVPGKGSTFWFTTRLQEAHVSPGSRQSESRVKSRGAPRHLSQEHRSTAPPAELADTTTRPMRVLVADGEEVNRLLCREMLAALGVDAATCGTGQQVLDRLDDEQFDLVLMDCQLPGLDGQATSRRIREQERASGRARTPIIALTAHAMAVEPEDWLAAGIDGHLAKPFRLSQLKAVLRTWLRDPQEIA